MKRAAGLSVLRPFDAVAKVERDMWKRDIKTMNVDELTRELSTGTGLVSTNEKTGVSVNLSTTFTCAGRTSICERVCFTLDHAGQWKVVLRHRLVAFALFCTAEPDYVCSLLIKHFDAARRAYHRNHGMEISHLRLNGSGDLTPQVVAVINMFVAVRPEIQVWISTRRANEAAQLVDRPNLFLGLSLDRASTQQHRAAAEQVCQNRKASNTYRTYLRLGKNEVVPPGTRITYDASPGLPAPPPGRGMQCPVDSGHLALGRIERKAVGGTACTRCRRCFSLPSTWQAI